MDCDPTGFADARETSIDIIVVSRVCLFRECIGRCLADDYAIHILDACAALDQALQSVGRLGPDMVLIDARFTGGAATGAVLAKASDGAQIVAVALEESEENILAWAEAGMAGYVADTVSIRNFPHVLRQIYRGGRADASPIVGKFIPRVGRAGPESVSRPGQTATVLTPRERVIKRYICAGLSNKDIARQLDISVGTAKAHVHNILGKLNLATRAQVAAKSGGIRSID